jgi:hypothetical protein
MLGLFRHPPVQADLVPLAVTFLGLGLLALSALSLTAWLFERPKR